MTNEDESIAHRWGVVIDKIGVVNTFECMVPCLSGGAMVASTLQIRRYKDAWERADYGEIERSSNGGCAERRGG